jgi:ribosomal protein S18 acetylase RimI-like enzyme
MALTDEELREAARHRGLKLVKSRKRNPGAGDYGLFGLTDESGKSLFGVGDDGLTATAEQIADFLRKGEASTWAASAETTPDRPKPARFREAPSEGDNTPLAIRPRRRTSSSAMMEHGARQRKQSEEREQNEPARAEKPQPERKPAPKPEPVSKPKPEPALAIRTARPADCDALRKLLTSCGLDVSAPDVKRAVTAADTRGEPVWIADRGGIVGCLVWHIVPTIRSGGTARVTMIAVDEGERRHGIGRALYEAALAEFRKRKVHSIEAMSDIEVRNANGFYRALGLKQVSYRFATEL